MSVDAAKYILRSFQCVSQAVLRETFLPILAPDRRLRRPLVCRTATVIWVRAV